MSGPNDNDRDYGPPVPTPDGGHSHSFVDEEGAWAVYHDEHDDQNRETVDYEDNEVDAAWEEHWAAAD